MTTDFLLIGQGIAGTLLSFELIRAGYSVMVIDQAPATGCSSLVAGAVLNPAAGKHWALSPQQELFIPDAVATYRSLEQYLNIAILRPSALLIFHEDEAQQQLFAQQQNTAGGLLKRGILPVETVAQLNNPFGIGEISPLYLVDASLLLQTWRQKLSAAGVLRQELFDHRALEIHEDGIVYGGIAAKKIVFCEGAAAIDNPLLASLPFTHNRGEALLISVPGLSLQYIYHHHIRLIPRSDGLFWCGSNYKWQFSDLLPDKLWRRETEERLKAWLNLPFEIVDHRVAKRPTTAGQFPFIGMHPRYSSVAIFNGLGTRGFSSGPFWATEMATLLREPGYQLRAYDSHRFAKLFTA